MLVCCVFCLQASIDGQVMSTQQYKKLLGTPPVSILGYGSVRNKLFIHDPFTARVNYGDM